MNLKLVLALAILYVMGVVDASIYQINQKKRDIVDCNEEPCDENGDPIYFSPFSASRRQANCDLMPCGDAVPLPYLTSRRQIDGDFILPYRSSRRQLDGYLDGVLSNRASRRQLDGYLDGVLSNRASRRQLDGYLDGISELPIDPVDVK